jgi:hypothetical protein
MNDYELPTQPIFDRLPVRLEVKAVGNLLAFSASDIALHQQGWSGWRIARELGLDRGTVAKYLAEESKPATNPANRLWSSRLANTCQEPANRLGQRAGPCQLV